MKKLLAISASILAENSQSRKLLAQFTTQWQQRNPDGKLVSRDLAADPLPHLDAATLAAWSTPAEQQSSEQRNLAAVSSELIEELQGCDTLVIGMPMYNFGVPSGFKAWIDQVARAGITFRYTAQGPEGLLKGKRAVILCSRGGIYAGTEKDSQTRYLTDVLGFLGITDVKFVYAEGLAMGEEQASRAMAEAAEQIAALSG
jgi:FMN-dependent NADH-azoreductase